MGRSGARYAQLGAVNTFTALQFDNAGISIQGMRWVRLAKTANYTAFTVDTVISVDATAGAVTIQLPLTSATGGIWVVQKTDASANTVTVQGTSGNINGVATFVISAQFGTVMVQSDGTNGFVLAKI